MSDDYNNIHCIYMGCFFFHVRCRRPDITLDTHTHTHIGTIDTSVYSMHVKYIHTDTTDAVLYLRKMREKTKPK